MENTDPNLITTIRRNYNLLLFGVLTAMPLFLWALIMIFDYSEGIIFRDPEKLGFELFVAFLFPLIVAPILSGLTLLIAKLVGIPATRWIVTVALGVIIPLVAFLLVFIAHFITRKIYIGNRGYLPSILSTMTNMNERQSVQKSEDPSIKLTKLKEMLDKGLISRQDYESQKNHILSRM